MLILDRLITLVYCESSICGKRLIFDRTNESQEDETILELRDDMVEEEDFFLISQALWYVVA